MNKLAKTLNHVTNKKVRKNESTEQLQKTPTTHKPQPKKKKKKERDRLVFYIQIGSFLIALAKLCLTLLGLE